MLNTSRLLFTPCSQVTRCLQWEVLPSHALTWSWGHFGRQGRHGGTESATDWEEEAAPTSWLPPPPRPAREPPRPLQSVAPSSPPPSEPPSPPSCATARAPLRNCLACSGDVEQSGEERIGAADLVPCSSSAESHLDICQAAASTRPRPPHPPHTPTHIISILVILCNVERLCGQDKAKQMDLNTG